MSKPKLELVGRDGNAFAILGRAVSAAKDAGWDKAKIDEFVAKAQSGDYNHLLLICEEYFDVS